MYTKINIPIILLITLLMSVVGCYSTMDYLNKEKVVKMQDTQNKCFLFGTYTRDFGIISPPSLKFTIHKYSEDGTRYDRSTIIYPMKLKDEKGLFLFELEPGRYKVVTIWMNDNYNKVKIPFIMKKGEAAYFGHVIFTENILLSRKYKKVNDYNEDVELFKNEYPNLSKLNFNNPVGAN